MNSCGINTFSILPQVGVFPYSLQEGSGQTFKPSSLNSISYTPDFNYNFLLLGKIWVFSASEILSLLETLKILTWRQMLTPKAYTTNLAGPTRVPAQLLTGNPVFRLAESYYL